MKEPKPLYGGQAIIEGVMFKGRNAVSMGVRKPDNSIYTESWTHANLIAKHWFFSLPFVRGFVALIDMMILGSKTLNKSASIAIEEETEEKTGWHIVTILSMIVGVVLALVIFKGVPFFSSILIGDWLGIASNNIVVLIEGLVKLLIFIAYIYLISLMPDIKRVFQYHGAEHKVIRAFEAGKKLTIANVQKASRFHPRCGTSFLILVIFISIGLYTLLPTDVPLWFRFAQRLLLLPVISGISFEFIQLTAKLFKYKLLWWLVLPGYAVQCLTTRQPDDSQVEVAIASFTECKDLQETLNK